MIDLTVLAKLSVIQPVSFETNKQKLLTLITSISPDTVLYESSDEMVLLEAFAYELTHRDEAVNARFRNMFPTLATGDALDLACKNFYGTTRLEGEDDKAFLERSLLSLQQSSTAGAQWSYIYHVKSVDARIVDVLPWRNVPGEVTVTWYAVVSGTTEEKEDASTQIEAAITKKIIDKKIKPLGDAIYYVGDEQLHIHKADEVDFSITATLRLKIGVDGDVAKAKAYKAVNAWLLTLGIGQDIKTSKITSILHVEGVDEVTLALPNGNLTIDKYSIGKCSSVNLSIGGQIDD
jgi:phage-related baseplate assembly protein